MKGAALFLAATLLVVIARLPSLKWYGLQALPLKIHNLAWALSLSLVGIDLIHYDSIGATTLILLMVAVLTFNLGAWTLLVAVRRKVIRTPVRVKPSSGKSVLLQRVIPVMFAIGCVLYLLAIARVFGVALLIHDPGLVRSEQGTDAFTSVFGVPGRILYGLGPLCFVAYAVPSASGIFVSRVRRGVVILLATLAMAASLGRTLLLISLAWSAVAWLLAPPRQFAKAARPPEKRPRRQRLKLVGGCVLGGLVLFQILAVLLGKTGQADPRFQRYVSPALRDSALTSVVVYLTGGVASFGNLIGDGRDEYPQEVSGPYYGGNILAPAARLIGIGSPQVVRPFTLNPLPNNSYTYLDAFWLDFRECGLLVGPFILGFALTLLAGSRPRSAEGTLVRSLMIALVLWAPFSYKYGDTFAWTSALLLWTSLILGRGQRRAGRPALLITRQ